MQLLSTKSASVAISNDIAVDLQQIIEEISPDKIFVLCDGQTRQHCLPLIAGVSGISEERTIVIKPGDDNKGVDALSLVWEFLSEGGATRHSLLINLGGGMPCDLGGFAAATYKRGLAFVNLPTSLLAMVDASVGGKTGINFNGFKNEVGTFRNAEMVLIHTAFLKTLDRANLLSGYAEMLKHALIDRQETLEQLLAIDPSDLSVEKLADFVAESVMVKDHYVENDPLEKNIRKALNLGHTIGHAYESLAMKKGRPALHGYAVAWGIIAELKLAVEKQGFPGDVQEGVEKYIHSIYGGHGFSESDFDSLYDLMKHDKKNCGERINFTLLNKVGEVVIDVDCGKEVVRSVIG